MVYRLLPTLVYLETCSCCPVSQGQGRLDDPPGPAVGKWQGWVWTHLRQLKEDAFSSQAWLPPWSGGRGFSVGSDLAHTPYGGGFHKQVAARSFSLN